MWFKFKFVFERVENIMGIGENACPHSPEPHVYGWIKLSQKKLKRVTQETFLFQNRNSGVEDF